MALNIRKDGIQRKYWYLDSNLIHIYSELYWNEWMKLKGLQKKL